MKSGEVCFYCKKSKLQCDCNLIENAERERVAEELEEQRKKREEELEDAPLIFRSRIMRYSILASAMFLAFVEVYGWFTQQLQVWEFALGTFVLLWVIVESFNKIRKKKIDRDSSVKSDAT